MNLDKLFETQKVLRNRIGYNKQDRYNKLVLALLVELGECANEWRGFKFWSQDQTPRTHKARGPYVNIEDADFYNPLLEEYVDCLHFIIEIGIELDVDINLVKQEIADEPFYRQSLTDHFNTVFNLAAKPFNQYELLFNAFVGLGEYLGFEWREIEQAYFEKNAINHQRQEVGY